MKDKFGHERGACLSCNQCNEFIFQEDSVRCSHCGCRPVNHEKLTLISSSEEIPTSTFNSIYSYPLLQASQCNVSGCMSEVGFDPNTGEEYLYCSFHEETASLSSLHTLNNDTESWVVQDIEDVNAGSFRHYIGDSNIQPDISLSTCSLVPTIHSPLIIPLCALPECQNQCHVDDNGTVHECCGYTHAMENQRRKALQQDVGANIIKGITHCLLPNCNNITWPFENYCGKTHADIGKQQGLQPPQMQTQESSIPKDTNTCIYPSCKKQKFTESDGTIHPYCGKTHAELAHQLGIFPTASETSDQCELEDCTRPKYKEGSRIHDYCSLQHAQKDAPNREAKILTSVEEVKKWLKQFSNLNIVAMEENEHAKPGGQLFKKFRDKMMSLPKDQRKTCLAFHGTPSNNITSICTNGYDSSRRRGQACGPGEYFATIPGTSMGYCSGGKKMLLNELLLGKAGTHHTKHGNIIVMKDPVHDLPRFVIRFK